MLGSKLILVGGLDSQYHLMKNYQEIEFDQACVTKSKGRIHINNKRRQTKKLNDIDV